MEEILEGTGPAKEPPRKQKQNLTNGIKNIPVTHSSSD